MWESLTNAETSRECWTAIEEIERCLAEHLARKDAAPDPLLGSGDAGVALFFAYLDAVRCGSDAGDRALDALGRSLDALTEMRLLPALYIGFSGIGWAVEHLTRHFFEGDDALTRDVDEALRRLLEHVNEPPPYELIGGLAGFGTYLVERLPHPAAAETLERIVDLLETRAEESDDGISWFTPPAWLTSDQRERMPEGCYNFGVAHGIPGVIGFLAAAWREGIDDARIPRLADGAIRWLLRRKLPETGGSVFPAYVAPGQRGDSTRTAWCYGDIGIAAILLSAARSFGRADWRDEALALARGAARRGVKETQTIDPGLCHGAAGLAHLFNRIHQATGDAEARDAALTWYRRALDMRRPGEGLAGLLSWISPARGEGSWRGEYGFLGGIAGYGLAMLAAVSDVEPAWDRVLLVSVPTRNGERGL
jgi:lantibiotic modifying enzyme